MKKLKTMFVFLFLGIFSMLNAQTIQVTGKVTDAADGQPLPGAYVFVKGGEGVATDIDGNFTITAAPDAILKITFIGYQDQDVTINGRSIINVLMVNNNVLDEVVISALGIARDKKSMGHAVQEVKGETLTKAGNLNVAGAIAGKVAGLQVSSAGGQVGSSSRFVIRGNSSLGNNEPLFVIDGVPMANDQQVFTNGVDNGSVDMGSGLMDINPDDIESITVLKGGAGALYGMRAGNGVILITTKSGKSNKDGVKIKYDGSFTFDNMYQIPEMQNKYGQGYSGSEKDYADWKAAGNTGSYQEYADANCYAWGGIDSNADESWGPRLDVGLNRPQVTSPRNADGSIQSTPWISHPNNIDNFIQTGYSQSHNISVMGSGEKFNARASLGIRDQKGTLPNTDQKRYNAQMNGHYDINKWLAFDMNLNFTHTHSDNLPMTEYQAGNSLQSLLEWFGRQVDMKDLEAKWDTIDSMTGKPYNWNPDYHQNPFYTMNKNTNELNRDRLFGKTSVWIKPTEWLKFEGRLGYDYYSKQTIRRTTYNTDYPSGGFWDYNARNHEVNADILMYVNKTFFDGLLNLNAVLGANYRDVKYSTIGLGADGLIKEGLFTISNAAGSPWTSYDHSHIRSNSVYGSFSFGFKNTLYLDISLRNDWSSTIDDPFFYPGVSVSWLPTTTFDIFEDSFIDYLKLRAGWAKIGSATSAYANGTYYNGVSNIINGQGQFYLPRTFPPQGLKPESIVTTEIGIEAKMFNNRLNLDMSLYSKKTTDQILSMAVAYPTGYSSMLINAGEFKNKGIEIQLSGVLMETKDIYWDATLNWSKDISHVVELYTNPTTGEELKNYQIARQWSTYLYAMAPDKDAEGNVTQYHSWGTLYGAGHKVDDNGNVVVSDSGYPVVENRNLGNVMPDWMASLSTEFRYKNLSFGIMFDYRHGGDFFSVTSMWGQYTGVLAMTAEGDVREKDVVFGKDIYKDLNFVKSDGSKNDIPVNTHNAFARAYNDRAMSVADGSFLKLREMHITYIVPKKVFRNLNFVKGANVSLIGNNIAILWLDPSNYAKIDPESGTSSGNSGVGLESGSIMPSRSIGIKVGLTF
ncbi:MAG: SusC/RagA family TonB-linked outer membrane protein [Bacteroidales bacterium]